MPRARALRSKKPRRDRPDRSLRTVAHVAVPVVTQEPACSSARIASADRREIDQPQFGFRRPGPARRPVLAIVTRASRQEEPPRSWRGRLAGEPARAVIGPVGAAQRAPSWRAPRSSSSENISGSGSTKPGRSAWPTPASRVDRRALADRRLDVAVDRPQRHAEARRPASARSPDADARRSTWISSSRRCASAPQDISPSRALYRYAGMLSVSCRQLRITSCRIAIAQPVSLMSKMMPSGILELALEALVALLAEIEEELAAGRLRSPPALP